MFVFFLMSFLRWERGADWENYYDFFIQGIEPSTRLSFDIGYQYLSYWIYLICGDYSVLLFVQAFILFVCTWKVLASYSVSPLFSVLIYFAIYFGGIYFVRQNVATALTLFSFCFIQKNEIYKFYALIFLASLLHISALIFLFAYPIRNLYLSDKKIIVLFCSSLLASIVLDNFLSSLIGGIGFNFVASKIDSYLETGADPTLTGAKEGTTLLVLLFKGFLSRSFILIPSIIMLGKLRGSNQVLNTIFNYCVVGACIYFLCAPISVVLARMSNYYEIFLLLLLPYWILIPKRKFNLFVLSVVLASYLFVRFLSGYNQYPQRFAPYKSIFNKDAPIYLK